MRQTRWIAFSFAMAATVLLVVAVFANHFPHPAAAGTTPPPSWLARLNLHRAAAQLPLITNVNASWSDGCVKHARYVAKNGVLTHDEVPGNAWYTPEGYSCGQSSNVMSSSLPRSDEEAIDVWMRAPFHGVGMLDPQLLQTGFGSYREAAAPIQMAAALDVLRGWGAVPPSVSFPIAWPGQGQSTPLTSYTGGETPNPLSSCPGFVAPTGLPLILQLGSGSVTPNVTAHSFMHGAVALPHCVFDETDYSNPNSADQSLGRAVLGGRDAIILIPRDPLIVGEQYTASITANGQTRAWTFTVSAVVTPTPTAGTPPPTPTPTPQLTDTDGDGCPDTREQVTGFGAETSGGNRDPLNRNDYFNPSHDGQNRVDDVLLVVQAYFKDDTLGTAGQPPYSPGYTPDTDRLLVGPNAWNLGPPNGLQRVDDILNVVHQYGHDCA